MLILFLMLSYVLNYTLISVEATNTERYYELENRTDILPYPLSRGSAVWVEEQESIYIFGGRNETDLLDRIMKYTPVNDQFVILNTHLPTVLMGSTAVFNGKYVYIFGGKDFGRFYDSILRFDPKTEKLINMSARLPNPTVGAAAIWTGEYIYFFGGCWGGIIPQKFDTILRYDPKRDNITVMNSTLPYGRSGPASTWDGKDIYIIGGSDGRKYSPEILKYSPENDTLTPIPATLPTGRLHIQAEYHNGSIYIFGGRGSPTTYYNQIIRYNIETNEVQILDQTLPTPSEFRMHAYDGENIYVIGGFSGPTDINQFIKFTPSMDLSASLGVVRPAENPYNYLGLILLIVVFVIIIILINNYRNKEKSD